MFLTRILIDPSSQVQIRDATYRRLYEHARNVEFDACLAFNLNALLTLEPLLLQEKLAFTQKFLAPNISIHTGLGMSFQPHTIPSSLPHQAPTEDNEMLHSCDISVGNVRSIELNLSNDPKHVGAQGHTTNSPSTIDATSEVGSIGNSFDRNFDNYIQIQRQIPQHATTLVSSCHQDGDGNGRPSSDTPTAQNISSVTAGRYTTVTDDTEQVDPQDHENISWSMVGVAPGLERMGNPIDQVFDDCQDSQGFDSRNPSSHDIAERTPADNYLSDLARMESYLTLVLSPSYTPKSANRALETKPRKATQAGGKQSASILTGLAGVSLSPLTEADSVRLGLLRSLILQSHEVSPESGTRQSFNDESLREIYRLGDRIINETALILNDWSEWSSREFQPPNAVLSPCHHLSSVEICAVAFRFLMETHKGVHRKSVHRRLAQILLYNFVAEVEQGIVMREGPGVFIPYKGRKPVTIAHDLTIAQVGISEMNGKKCNRKEIGEEKNHGKRWWRLGSGIGLVTVLTCASDLDCLMGNRSFSDDSLKLLVNYVRHAYPNAVAHFQSIDPVIQVLFANPSLLTNASVSLDRLQSRFNPIFEQVQWFDTNKAMDVAARQLLCIFRQNENDSYCRQQSVSLL